MKYVVRREGNLRCIQSARMRACSLAYTQRFLTSRAHLGINGQLCILAMKISVALVFGKHA